MSCRDAPVLTYDEDTLRTAEHHPLRPDDCTMRAIEEMDTGLTRSPKDIESTGHAHLMTCWRMRRRPVGHRARRHRPAFRLDGLDRLGAPTREVELAKTIAAIRPDDQMMSIRPAHAALPGAARHRGRAGRRRRVRAADRPRKPAGAQCARAAAKARTPRASRSCCRRRPMSRPSRFASYLLQTDRRRTASRPTTSASPTSCSTRRRTR